MANKPNDKFFRTPRKAQSVIKASNSLDIAARYLVYKLYEATDGRPMMQWLLGGIGETRETVLRSVELGWVHAPWRRQQTAGE
jgi:hypothetical protein